jgi:protein arginine N-methyltransferase 3
MTSARDRFLSPGGLMVPSQTRLVISAITGDGVWKDKVAFWDDVYGRSASFNLLIRLQDST